MSFEIKAIIFDYGNVLSESQPLPDVREMAAILDLSLPQFSVLYWRFRIEYDAASLDPILYWKTVAQTASRCLQAISRTFTASMRMEAERL